jgi:hypothetical protein
VRLQIIPKGRLCRRRSGATRIPGIEPLSSL